MSDRRSIYPQRKDHSGVRIGWNGVERRSKTDRRKGERRDSSRLQDTHLSPKALVKLQVKRDRKEKEKAVSRRKKDGKLRKEVGI